MAITQYSRIQHRRGTYTELNSMPGPLNTSELGHIIDQQRLFIGNGQVSEGSPVVGNTEIITDVALLNNPLGLKYIYQSNTGVKPQTGPSANTPVVRSIGQILDDCVSVKSFGAMGDGLTDDTAAINRALQQLYTVQIPSNLPAGYRKLFFPAGVYNISNYIYLPPFANLIGESPEGTIIRMVNSNTIAAVRTADSLFQNGAQMGTGGAALPTKIRITDMTIQHMYDQVIVRLERASDVHFDNVLFLGAWNTSLTGSNSAAIYLDSLGSVYAPKSIKATRCSFMFTFYGLQVTANAPNAQGIYFDDCFFSNQNNSIFTTNNTRDVKVSNSNFKLVVGSVIVASPLSANVSSINNTFDTCGAAGVPQVWFQNNVADYATACQSIGDQFINSQGPTIQNDGAETLIISNQGPLVLQNVSINPVLQPITLSGQAYPPNPASTTFTMNLTEQNTAFVDYTLIRGTNVRIGRLFILCKNSDLSETVLTDLFSENNPTNIVFDYSISGSTLTIVYTDNQATEAQPTAGPASVWNIQPKFWIS